MSANPRKRQLPGGTWEQVRQSVGSGNCPGTWEQVRQSEGSGNCPGLRLSCFNALDALASTRWTRWVYTFSRRAGPRSTLPFAAVGPALLPTSAVGPAILPVEESTAKLSEES